MTLAEVRSRLTATLAGRSEPVITLGDRYVPAAALYTGARRRVRRAGLPVADDLDMPGVDLHSTDTWVVVRHWGALFGQRENVVALDATAFGVAAAAAAFVGVDLQVLADPRRKRTGLEDEG